MSDTPNWLRIKRIAQISQWPDRSPHLSPLSIAVYTRFPNTSVGDKASGVSVSRISVEMIKPHETNVCREMVVMVVMHSPDRVSHVFGMAYRRRLLRI